MGSHYIPVGKLKIDKDLLDIACPAAGYTPELICPAAGWLPPEPDGTWEPDTEIPDPDPQEIILLCDDSFPHLVRVRAQGAYTLSVTTVAGVPITSANYASGTTVQYDFPTQGIGAQYYVRIKGNAANITLFNVVALTPYDSDFPILAAIFNTPNIVTLTSAFEGVRKLRKVDFISTLNSLSGFGSFLRATGMQKFTMPPSLPACTTLQNFATDSQMVTFDFNSCSLPACTRMDYLLDGCSKLKTLICNPDTTAASLFNISYMLRNCGALVSADLNFRMYHASNALNISHLCNGNINLRILKLPNLQATFTDITTTITSFVLNCANLEYLEFRGKFKPTVGSTISGNYFYLKEVVCDEEFRAMSFPSTLYLEKLRFADNLSNGIQLYMTNLKEITNLRTQLNITMVTISSYQIKNFNWPGLQPNRFFLGNTNGLLETVEIDWAGAPWATGASTGNPNISLKGKLSTAELERIWTALPDYTGFDTRYFRASDNPGYTAADKTILTNKNWVGF